MIMQQIRPVPPQRPLRRGGRRGAAAARGGGAAGGREPAGHLRAAPRRPPAAGDWGSVGYYIIINLEVNDNNNN